MAKRKVTPQTRIKLSRAAKGRRRGVKGTPTGGKFLAGVFGHTVKYSAGGSMPRGDDFGHPFTGQPHQGTKAHGYDKGITNPSDLKERGHATRAEIDHNLKTQGANVDDLAYHVTRSRAMGSSGPQVTREDINEDRPIRTRSSDVRNLNKLRAEGKWQTEPGLYTQESAMRPAARRKYKPTSTFVKDELAPSHKEWLENALTDPNSEFNAGFDASTTGRSGRYRSPGQRNRVRLYTQRLQEGASHEQALEGIRGERRGRKPASATGRATRPEFAQERKEARGRKSRYESVAPTQREFQVGVSGAHAESMGQIKRRFPTATERDMIRIQQYQRMNVQDEIQKNQKWTHETKRASLLGDASREKGPERVVFLTTNIGYPAPSVPSDSLIGQYVIKRRKNFMRELGTPDRDLKGKFPEAVRDQHVLEMATGLSFGAEGRWGAFQKSGWRRGAKRSPNYGKPTPIGSQVLYDSQGRPMYDSEGNIRFTEGSTRPFKFESMKDAGVRVFIG